MAVIKRLHYFDHQFLIESDFTDQQAYHVDMLRRQNRLLHTAGAAEGLTVTGSVGATSVTVAPGTALDTEGREIVLLDPRTVPLPGAATQGQVYIVYREAESDPRSAADVTGNTRITEDPALIVRATVPVPDAVPSGGVLLAQLTLAGGQLAAAPNNDVRARAAAVVSDDLAVKSLQLKRDGVVSTQWPRLSCQQPNQVTVETDLVLPSGKIGVGTAPQSALHLLGGNGDLATTEGDLKIGDATNRLKIGVARAGGGAGDVRVRAQGGTNRLMLGSGTADVLTVQNGRVGIGTVTPTETLDVAGNMRLNDNTLLLRGAADANHGVGWFGGATKRFAATNVDGPVTFGLGGGALGSTSGGQRIALAWNNQGTVGIGTTTPTNRLHVAGNLGIRQNRLYVSGGDGRDNWSSLSYNAHHNDANDNWTFPDPTRRAVTLEMDDTGGTPRFQVWSTRAASPTGWVQRFSINGETGDVAMAQNGGTVAIGTPATPATLDIQGDVRSPKWNVQQLINNRAGNTALGATFTSGGGVLVVFASGSGYSPGGVQIGMDINIDGTVRGSARGFANEPGSHKSFVANALVVTGVPAGSHTLTLVMRAGTSIDFNDFFNTTIFEFPWTPGFVFTPIVFEPIILQPIFRRIP